MTDTTLFSAHPVTWEKVRDLYGEAAQVTGVKAWYSIAKGWQAFPATSAMAMPPEQQVLALAKEGAVTLQLYVDVNREETHTPDFNINELLNPQCSISSTSSDRSEITGTRPSITSASSRATKTASRRASKSTGQGGAPASPPPATSEESTTTSSASSPATEIGSDN